MRKGLPPALALLLVLTIAPTADAQRRAATACDPFASRACLMPFPNDMNLTVKDRKTPTGLRLRLPAKATPANKDGKRITTGDYNRLDGFSPGQTIVVRVKGLNTQRAFSRSRLVPLSDMSQSFAKRAGVVVINARTRKRQLIYAELDANAKSAKDKMLLIHPGENFDEGGRYIVALRGLRTASGKRIQPSKGFRALKRGAGPKRHRARYKKLFRTLKRAGIRRANLTLAWDFTVASEKSLTSRMLHIRDDAFAKLGDRNLADGKIEGSAPQYTITSVTDNPDPRILKRVSGTFQVPCYLNKAGCPPGATFNYASKGKDALPTQRAGNFQTAKFECEIPNAATSAPAHAALYGHGLLGGPDQIDENNIRDMSQEHDFAFCATAWSGMSAEDVPNAIKLLGELSGFASFPDRLQQGFVNQMYLGRLLIHPQGLTANPVFAGLVDPSTLYYDGNSQGGIMGTALTAMAPDYTRAVLGVPGINFSVLLTRSSNWDTYGQVFNPGYPNQADRPLVLALISILWDRGEGDGWAHHVTTDPPPGTPPHRVLMHAAVGDFQVSTYQADVLARTIGARAHKPAFLPGRSLEKTPVYRIPAMTNPFAGSAIVYWDNGPVRPDGSTGNGPTPLQNTPPREGKDPHSAPRSTPAARQQKATFLLTGNVVDVCNGQPCQSDFTRPPS
jgi:hypothetical protein